jgi:hypothetical protein
MNFFHFVLVQNGWCCIPRSGLHHRIASSTPSDVCGRMETSQIQSSNVFCIWMFIWESYPEDLRFRYVDWSSCSEIWPTLLWGNRWSFSYGMAGRRFQISISWWPAPLLDDSKSRNHHSGIPFSLWAQRFIDYPWMAIQLNGISTMD